MTDDPRDVSSEPPRDDEVDALESTARDELATLAGEVTHRDLVGEARAREAGEPIQEQHSLWGDATRRFLRNRGSMIGMVALVLMVLMSVGVPMFAGTKASCTHDVKGHRIPNPHPNRACRFDSGTIYALKFQPVSTSHPFGTDDKGRDLWLRSWEGGRISLLIGFSVALTILIIGVVYGAIAGYFGGRIDNLMMRVLDALYGLPYIPFAIISIQLILTRWPRANPLVYMVPALSITAWFTAARIIRGQVLSLKQNEYVESARSSGARWGRVLFRHVVPNTLGVLVISAFLEVPGAILGEATLSFLGLGVRIPDASWGSLAQDGYTAFKSHPNFIAAPAGLIAITVLSAIAVADGLRDALDPRGKRN